MIRKARTASKASVIFLTILIAAAMGAPIADAAPSNLTVSVEPTELDLRPGDDFEVRLMIDGVEDLSAFEATIGYDPSVIELTDAAKGDFLASTGRMTFAVGPQIDAEEGTIALGALSVGQEAGPNGSGVLATVSGTALTEGSSALQLQKVQVFNTATEALSVVSGDGEVTVNGGDAAASQSPDASARTAPWVWIAAGALLVVLAAAAVAFALLRRKPQGGSQIDAS